MAADRDIPGVLRIRIHGRGGDAGAALRRWRHHILRAREAGLNRLLVIRDLQGPLISEGELATLVAQLARLDLRGLRVALVQTRHERHHIVVRLLRLALEADALAIVGRVLPVVPARVAQVDPSRERDGLVDDHELLMMARAERVLRGHLRILRKRPWHRT